MRAAVGDRIVVEGHGLEPEALEARGVDGGSPDTVRWDHGHQVLFVPGPGAGIRGGHRR